MRTALILILAALSLSLPACKDAAKPTKAQKAAAKQTKDAELLALPYPKSSGSLPAGIELAYDAAADRTTMTLHMAALRPTGSGADKVSSAALHLTSSFKGKTRDADDPEGSIDGRVVVQTSAPGVLAYSGAPGTIAAATHSVPLKPVKDGFASARQGGGEESLRFKLQTPDLVAAANSNAVSFTFATLKFDLTDQQRADLKEFAARLNPRP